MTRRFFAWVALVSLLCPMAVFAEDDIVDIVFPVEGEATFSDDFDDERSGGRTHNAIDIIADKMTPVLAVTDGEITFAPTDEPSYGFIVRLRGDDGYEYAYLHLNNDTPGTDDGNGGAEHAYAAGIERGERVVRGEHIAYVGDSGNAEEVSSHLHFEMSIDDVPVNPYASLVAAYGDVGYDFDPEAETARATSINDDKAIPEAVGAVNCVSDTLIRTPDISTVYYCGRDGGRYLFQNESTYFSWYEDYDDVQTISSAAMASVPLRGTVTYKPGTVMVKLLSVPKVYAIGANGTLRWIPSAYAAETLYGEDWPTLVRDLPDGFFPAYDIGETVERTD